MVVVIIVSATVVVISIVALAAVMPFELSAFVLLMVAQVW